MNNICAAKSLNADSECTSNKPISCPYLNESLNLLGKIFVEVTVTLMVRFTHEAIRQKMVDVGHS